MKRHILNSEKRFYLFIFIVSIFAGFGITRVCNTVQDYKINQVKTEKPYSAITRVADAFEWYNERRF